MNVLHTIVAVAALALLSCGSAGLATDQPDGFCPATVAGDAGGLTDTDLVGPSPDVPDDIGAQAADAPGPAPDLCTIRPLADLGQCPGPGCLGWPCTAGHECLSGVCLDDYDGRKCTEGCDDGCPAGWTCSSLAVGCELIYLCVPQFPRLCQPCESDAACTADLRYVTHAVCVEDGSGNGFCGGDCAAGQTCPEGFECVDVTDGAGQPGRQCVPVPGSSCATGYHKMSP